MVETIDWVGYEIKALEAAEQRRSTYSVDNDKDAVVKHILSILQTRLLVDFEYIFDHYCWYLTDAGRARLEELRDGVHDKRTI